MVLGHLTHRKHDSKSEASPRASLDDSRAGDPSVEGDETVVDEAQGNILSHIISQLRPGADLSRVTLPTFFLEPRSMLERITNFMAHPEMLLPMPDIEDPTQRFVAAVKFYLSGWHIKPPGVKKPMNPILGETFYGYWDYKDGTRGYYISEQTSHHPPKSSYFYMAPDHNIRIDGTLKPRSKFLGNSAASMMEGLAVMRFLNRNERYFITQPNMYARGILFGKMQYELGDHSFVRCPELGLVADIEFKTKGYFSGKYNAIGGFIKDAKTDKHLFELSGEWNGEMFIKNLATGKKELVFNAVGARPTYPSSRPVEEQEWHESQRLWAKVMTAIKQRNQDVATDEKSRIEDAQREEATKHPESQFQPKLFRKCTVEGEEDLDWILNAKIDGATAQERTAQILAVAPVLPKRLMQQAQGGGSGQRSEAGQQQVDGAAGAVSQHQAHGRETVPAAAPQQQQQQQQHGAPPSEQFLANTGQEGAAGQHGSIPIREAKAAVVTRQDSYNDDVDEFVDAKAS